MTASKPLSWFSEVPLQSNAGFSTSLQKLQAPGHLRSA